MSMEIFYYEVKITFDNQPKDMENFIRELNTELKKTISKSEYLIKEVKRGVHY